MCKIPEDMRNEVAREVTQKVTKEVTKRVSRETAILTTIETYREVGIEESAIEERILSKFEPSREVAKEYILGKST